MGSPSTVPEVAFSKIDILLTFDRYFWPPAFAVMRSICLTTLRRKDLLFHAMYHDLPDEAFAKFAELEQEFGCKVEFYPVTEHPEFKSISIELERQKRITSIGTARLLLDLFLPESVKRVLYLDSDLLVLAPIEELYEMDLRDNPIGAIKDASALHAGNGRDIAQRRHLIEPADPFFNSGVMLIDRAGWRNTDVIGVARRLVERGELKNFRGDQMVLNYIFARNWQHLPRKWNMFGTSKAVEALDPSLVHYVTASKPWILFARSPFARVYRHVMTNDLFYSFMRMRWTWWFMKLLGRR